MKKKTIEDIIDEQFAIDFTYDSVKLSGNSLSKKEVVEILKREKKKNEKNNRSWKRKNTRFIL